MANPFFNRFSGNNGPAQSGPFGNISNMMNQFQQFKSQFQGDPKEQVQQLLNSGQMSQDQFNWLSNIATQFQKMLHSFPFHLHGHQ